MWNQDFIASSSESENSYRSPPNSLRFLTPVHKNLEVEQSASSRHVTSPPLRNLVALEEPERTKILADQKAKLRRKTDGPVKVLRNDFSQPILHPEPKIMSGRHLAEEFDEEVLEIQGPNDIRTVQFPEAFPISQEKEKRNQVPKHLEDIVLEFPEEEKQETRENPSKEILLMNKSERKSFLTSSTPKGVTIQCTIRRERSGFSRFYPKYYMHFSQGSEFVAAAKKRGGNRTSNYLITMNMTDFSKNSVNFLGKVRSNFMGTEFHIYNDGLNPRKKKATFASTRQELGGVLYDSTLFKKKNPRKMQVIIPSVNERNQSTVWKPRGKKDGIMNCYKEGNTQGMNCYYNKPPRWNHRMQCFALDFKGRVDRASVKNFILVSEGSEDTHCLLFGKVSEHSFNLDFTWPISPIQAFGIALTSLDSKFACE